MKDEVEVNSAANRTVENSLGCKVFGLLLNCMYSFKYGHLQETNAMSTKAYVRCNGIKYVEDETIAISGAEIEMILK